MHGDDFAHLVHAPVGICLIRGKEAVWMGAQRLLGQVTETQPDHRALDPVFVHLRECIGNVVLLFTGIGYVLEHILCRHAEHVMALSIHQQGLDPVIEIAVILTRYGKHQVDNADIGRHWHGAWSLCLRRSLRA